MKHQAIREEQLLYAHQNPPSKDKRVGINDWNLNDFIWLLFKYQTFKRYINNLWVLLISHKYLDLILLQLWFSYNFITGTSVKKNLGTNSYFAAADSLSSEGKKCTPFCSVLHFKYFSLTYKAYYSRMHPQSLLMYLNMFYYCAGGSNSWCMKYQRYIIYNL